MPDSDFLLYDASVPSDKAPKTNCSITSCCDDFQYSSLTLCDLPEITSSLYVIRDPGTAFSYVISARNSILSLNASSLPEFLTFDGVNTISGNIPEEPNSYSFDVSATNSCGQTFEIVILNSCVSPVLTSETSVTGNANDPFSYTITADNFTKLNAYSLPYFLSFNGVDIVSGTLPVSGGDFSFVISATNDCNTVSEPISLSVISEGQADYAIVRYGWTDVDGRDLDTLTSIANLDPSVNGKTVGYCGNSNPNVGPYLTWGGDNTTPTGFEAVLLDFKQMHSDFPAIPSIIIDLSAHWYGLRLTGDYIVQYETYVGGTMEQVGTDFINVGGVSTGSSQIGKNNPYQSADCTGYTSSGTIVYNTATKIGVLNP